MGGRVCYTSIAHSPLWSVPYSRYLTTRMSTSDTANATVAARQFFLFMSESAKLLGTVL